MFEYLLNETSDTKAPISDKTTAHSRSRTLTVAFSDQAVQQVRITPQMMQYCTVGAGNNFSCAPATGPFPDYAKFLGTIEIQH
jgi:vancomycin resistance protein YoaR